MPAQTVAVKPAHAVSYPKVALWCRYNARDREGMPLNPRLPAAAHGLGAAHEHQNSVDFTVCLNPL